MKMSSFIPFSKVFFCFHSTIQKGALFFKCTFCFHTLLKQNILRQGFYSGLLSRIFPLAINGVIFIVFHNSPSHPLYLSFIIARMSLSLSKCHTHTHTCTQISVCALFSSLSLLLTQTHPKYLCNSCFASCFLTRGQPIPQFQTKASAKTTKTILEFSV